MPRPTGARSFRPDETGERGKSSKCCRRAGGDDVRVEQSQARVTGEVVRVEGEQVGDAVRSYGGDEAGFVCHLALALVGADELPPLGGKVRRVSEEWEHGFQPSQCLIALRDR